MSSLWRELLKSFIRVEAQPVEKFSHQPRLYTLSVQIGQNLCYDDDVLFAAVWLHDLGVFTGHRPEEPESLAHWDNTAYAMRRAPDILEQFGFPPEKVASVVETIRTHQAQCVPKITEGIIIRDADILEQLGATAVMRTVCKVGRDTRFRTFSEARDSLRQALTGLPPQLQLDSAKSLAEPRIAALGGFLRWLDLESGETLG